VGSAAAGVAEARAAENGRCLDAFGKGQLPRLGAASLRSCLARDSKGKLAKQVAKLGRAIEKSCSDAGDVPDFGVGPGGAAAIAHLNATQTTAAVLDALSENLFVSALPCAGDAPGCRCQAEVVDGEGALGDAVRSEFAACARRALKGGASSADALAACLDDPALAGSVAADTKGKLAKRASKLAKQIGKRCGGVAASEPFPGQCVGRSGDALAACVAGAARCRACLGLEATHGLDADCDLVDDGAADQSCPGGAVAQATFLLPSEAKPPHTPGTPGAEVVDNPKLLAQFGGPDFDLNQVTTTRYAWRNPPAAKPDAILVLIPGFEGGASGFKILAENLIPRVYLEHGKVVEVWAVDRRGHQLEDRLGLDLAEAQGDAQLALDWLFGAELGLPTPPPDLPRRAQFYNTSDDIPFLAEWTPLVHSIDFDAVVEAARAVVGDNVFLGGHSAGTGFTARYAATDFDLAGSGTAAPGYAKLRGLVLLEGGGGSSAGTPPDDATLDRIEQRFDGDLLDAVESGEPRCTDLLTPCTPDVAGNDPVACAAFSSQGCGPVTAYASLAGLLSPELLASAEIVALQAASDPDGGKAILQQGQGGDAENTAIAAVPALSVLAALPQSTAEGLIGLFVDDEGFAAGRASFIAMSVGAPGPPGNPPRTWLDLDETEQYPPCPGTGCVTPDNGPAPTALPPVVWGVEQEPIRLDRLLSTLYLGETNFTDWYYPSSGLSLTQGLPGLDSTLLSADPPLGRGRRDIENLTQADAIDIPVIAFGGTNGLTPVSASYLPFAESIAACAAPSCDGTTPRVVDAASPSEAFPTFGGVAGGYEVYMSEGYAHVDPLAAEDGDANQVIAPLAAFLARNVQ
jgi:pimeloyl-ACP methyl ester carboxylesterase